MISIERLAGLIDVMPYGVAVLADGNYRYVNQAWAEHLGRSASAHSDRRILDDIHEGDRAAMASWLASQRFDRRPNGEFRFLKANGDQIALELHPLQPRQYGAVVSHAFVSRDITYLRKLQARILVADRAMSVGALAAGVAHEINNPLSYVLGNIAYVAETLDPMLEGMDSEHVTDIREALVEAREGVERAAKIVANLQAFASPIDDAHGRAISVIDAIEGAIAMAYPQIRQRARLVRDFAEIPPVAVPASKLSQVFLNLLLNAATALPDGQAAENEIRVATRLDDRNRVVIEFSDTGPGIPPDRIGHVFDTFFTAQPIGVGSGLGLSIAHSIVREMAGRITAESVLGKGATFRVFLPAYRDDDEEKPDPFHVPEPTGDLRPSRILIVDDEPLIGSSLARALKQHAVHIASSGTEAIEFLEDRTVSPDLVFLDLIMPDRTGMDVYRWVKENRPELSKRIVFMTGGVVGPRMLEFLAQVDNYRIEKPFDVKGVRNFVKLQMLAAKDEDDDDD